MYVRSADRQTAEVNEPKERTNANQWFVEHQLSYLDRWMNMETDRQAERERERKKKISMMSFVSRQS